MPYPFKRLAIFGELHLNSNGNLVIDGRPQWYVNSTVTASLSGLSWEKPLKTIAEAITKSAAGDTINIKGEHEIAATLALSKELWVNGWNTSPNLYNTMIYPATAAPLFTVTAHMCKILNCGLVQNQASSFIELTSGYKTEIKGNRLDGWGTGTNGIVSAAGGDCPDVVIENNYFRSIAGDHIVSNWTRALIKDNRMIVSANYSGISHVPTGGSRPDTWIDRNMITGANDGDTGIEIVGAPTSGALHVTRNLVSNCSTSITQGATHTGFCQNFAGGDGGGTVFDPIA